MHEARAVLGVVAGATEADERSAFRRRLRDTHPDVAGPRADAGVAVARLTRALAVLRAARKTGASLPSSEGFTSSSGRGASALVDGRVVLVGSSGFMDEQHVVPDPALTDQAASHQKAGETVVMVAVDGQMAGLIAIADVLKPSAPAASDASGYRGCH